MIRLTRLTDNEKVPGAAEPIPLSQYACEVLGRERRNKFPSFKGRVCLPKPYPSESAHLKSGNAWKATLKLGSERGR